MSFFFPKVIVYVTLFDKKKKWLGNTLFKKVTLNHIFMFQTHFKNYEYCFPVGIIVREKKRCKNHYFRHLSLLTHVQSDLRNSLLFNGFSAVFIFNMASSQGHHCGKERLLRHLWARLSVVCFSWFCLYTWQPLQTQTD